MCSVQIQFMEMKTYQKKKKKKHKNLHYLWGLDECPPKTFFGLPKNPISTIIRYATP